LGAISMAQSYLDYYSSGAANHPSDAMAAIFGDRVAMDPTGRAQSDPAPGVSMICIVGCSDVGHKVAAVMALIDVNHSANGTPVRWRVAVSSGDRDFDDEALAAVEVTTRQVAPDTLAVGSGYETPRWAFAATAYRWGRLELLSDPQFTPAGRRLDEHSGILGETRMVTEVRLVAIRQRTAAAPSRALDATP